MNKNKPKNVSQSTQGETRVQHVQTRETITSIPLHHPEFLKGYKEVDPSFPDRILAMGEKEQEARITAQTKVIEEESLQRVHNREMEKTKHNDATSGAKRGLNLGFVCAVLILGLIGYGFKIVADGEVMKTIIISMSVLIGIFVLGRSGILLYKKYSATAGLQKTNSSEESNEIEPHGEEKEVH